MQLIEKLSRDQPNPIMQPQPDSKNFPSCTTNPDLSRDQPNSIMQPQPDSKNFPSCTTNPDLSSNQPNSIMKPQPDSKNFLSCTKPDLEDNQTPNPTIPIIEHLYKNKVPEKKNSSTLAPNFDGISPEKLREARVKKHRILHG